MVTDHEGDIDNKCHGKIDKTVLMDNIGNPFAIAIYSEGKLKSFMLLNDVREVLRFENRSDSGPYMGSYCKRTEHHQPVGDCYYDLDFNGSMDCKIKFGQDHKILSRHILLEDNWAAVDSMGNGGVAATSGKGDKKNENETCVVDCCRNVFCNCSICMVS